MAAVVVAMMDGEPSEVLTTSIATSNSTLALNGPIFNLSSLTSDGDKTDYSSEGMKFETAGLISDSGVIGVETSQGLVLSVGDSITVGQVSLAGATNTLDLQNTVYLPAHFLNADSGQLFEVQGDATGDSCHGLTTASPPQLDPNLSDTVAVVSAHSNTGHELKKRKGGWPKGRKRKKEKLFQGPKAPASAYVIFAIERRRQIKELNPELPFVEVTKLLGGEWSAMCPVEKQKYIDLAERDKQRYIDELKLYQQSEAYQNFLKRKRALCEEDSPNLDIIDTSHYLDNIEEEEGLYCKVCDQYFSNMHNRKEHLFGKQHLQNVTNEFEKEMEKQDEGDVLNCDDLSQDMLSVSADHPLLGATSASFVVGNSEPLDVDHFIHQFMQKNLERELEMGHLRKMAEAVRQQNMALISKIKQLQQIQGKLEQEMTTTKGISAALSAQLDALRMVPTLFGVINF